VEAISNAIDGGEDQHPANSERQTPRPHKSKMTTLLQGQSLLSRTPAGRHAGRSHFPMGNNRLHNR